MNLKTRLNILKGTLVVIMLLALVYIAVLFTGVGDGTVYKYTGHDITGSGKKEYHDEIHRREQELRKSVAQLPKTTIEIDSVKYDFGQIQEGDKVEHTYKLTNTGTENLIIADVRVGCGCTVADFTKEPVPTGGVGEVSIVFDSTEKEGHTEKALNVYTNTEHTPTTLAFMADISKAKE